MKKIWLIVLGIVIVISLSIGAFFLAKQTSSSIVSPQANGSDEQTLEPTKQPAIQEQATWKDDAWFSFTYPKALAVNKHEEDNDSYAHVELTDKSHPGNVIVWVKDLPSKVTTLDAWVKQKKYADATVFDTTLGGQDAKKISMIQPSRMLTTGTISDGLLFYVEGTLTYGEYWTPIFDAISGSFQFASEEAPQATGQSAPSGGEDIDEEEVIQ